MKTKEEIDAEFDNEFLQWNTSGQFNLDKISPDKIKSFWHKKLSQQKQEMVEEIEKELIWVGDELVTEGDYGDFNKVLLNLKQKLNK